MKQSRTDGRTKNGMADSKNGEEEEGGGKTNTNIFVRSKNATKIRGSA